MGKNQHVVKKDDRWAVRGEGNSRATSLHDTQKEAIAAGKEIARNQESELFIHATDGKIRDRMSYGPDPESRPG